MTRSTEDFQRMTIDQTVKLLLAENNAGRLNVRQYALVAGDLATVVAMNLSASVNSDAARLDARRCTLRHSY